MYVKRKPSQIVYENDNVFTINPTNGMIKCEYHNQYEMRRVINEKQTTRMAQNCRVL